MRGVATTQQKSGTFVLQIAHIVIAHRLDRGNGMLGILIRIPTSWFANHNMTWQCVILSKYNCDHAWENRPLCYNFRFRDNYWYHVEPRYSLYATVKSES